MKIVLLIACTWRQVINSCFFKQNFVVRDSFVSRVRLDLETKFQAWDYHQFKMHRFYLTLAQGSMQLRARPEVYSPAQLKHARIFLAPAISNLLTATERWRRQDSSLVVPARPETTACAWQLTVVSTQLHFVWHIVMFFCLLPFCTTQLAS